MQTVKLFEENPYLSEFTAKVISCEKENDVYKTVLNQTAFFYEGGGQSSDTGFIGNAKVLDVQLINNEIYHYTAEATPVGQEISCKINFTERYKKMQIHTGEHIVSGVMHNLYGLENVGFHLGKNEVTLDFNAALTREQLNTAETEANQIIYKNLPVICYYPSKDQIKNINYRSKKEILENLRIVEIKGHDICACCAPHVKNTGEVGIIKLINFEKHKNGTRIYMACAQDALADYQTISQNNFEISSLLCAKPYETANAVRSVLLEKEALFHTIGQLKRNIIALKSEAVTTSDTPLVLFEDDMDIPNMRNLANNLMLKRPQVYIFSQIGNNFNYLCAAKNGMKEFATKINQTFKGKGGGSDSMVQGTVTTTKEDLLEFLNANIDKF